MLTVGNFCSIASNVKVYLGGGNPAKLIRYTPDQIVKLNKMAELR